MREIRLAARERLVQAITRLSCDLQKAVTIFPTDSVDSVFLVDVIEHIKKEEALICLHRIVSIAKSQVVLFTPIGFMPQESLPGGLDQWGMGGGAYQEHKSTWHPEDFPAEDGWQIIACKDYHKLDAYGEQFARPFGAMWAIMNKK